MGYLGRISASTAPTVSLRIRGVSVGQVLHIRYSFENYRDTNSVQLTDSTEVTMTSSTALISIPPQSIWAQLPTQSDIWYLKLGCDEDLDVDDQLLFSIQGVNDPILQLRRQFLISPCQQFLGSRVHW
jgi:hypothetical protein